MSKVKLFVAVCAAACMLSALASTVAYAEWDVGGAKLVGSAAIATTAAVGSSGQLLVPATGVTITCTANVLGINGGRLIAPAGILASSIVFQQCANVGESGCTLATKTIGTVPVHGVASLEGALNTYILVLPETKNTFATIAFTTAEPCAFAGTTQPVTGDASLLIHNGIHPAVTQLVLAFSLKGALKLGSGEALLENADALIQLASGATWNFL